MIKIFFYQSFEIKEVKYLQSNKGGVENPAPPTLPPPPSPPTKKIFRRLVNLNAGK